MKAGDKVLVTYKDGDQFVGRITGETEKSWKIEFDDGNKKTIRKTMDIEVIDDPETVVDETPVEEPAVEVPDYIPSHYAPSKRLKRKNLLIFLFIMAATVGIGLVIIKSVGLF